MSLKEKLIDALVDLSVELSAAGAGGTVVAEAATVLERIISGLPRTSTEAAEMLAGALIANSVEGPGSTFAVSLPLTFPSGGVGDSTAETNVNDHSRVAAGATG